ncbi:beta-Ig-H3/fasciclin [Calothrix parasitica NIES-267]|uniref:Beta-Ig-H3/fasciclin n=1 Tax=Calothrix parasitica NIES-267 TaxID=1973488 RepID=A0A1Z4LRQ2_9CYAN|nr:beta-Ig-H3/fasciclin [Calothrix parasitica NIES-267]
MANNASTSSNLPTIAGIVSQSGNEFDNNNQDFDVLLEALETADLVGAVDDVNADLTVFAPTDAAFIELAQDFGYQGTDEGEAFTEIANALTELGEGDPVPLLQDILLYHVSPEAKEQAQIIEQAQVETLLEGASFTVEDNELVDNEPDLSNPSFISDLANIEAANGIIQGIDRVLLPIDIPGNEMAENIEDDILNGGTKEDNNFLQLSNNQGRIVFNLDNLIDFIDDLSAGEAKISFAGESTFGDLSFQQNDNSTGIFGGGDVLIEVSGIFSDAFVFGSVAE